MSLAPLLLWVAIAPISLRAQDPIQDPPPGAAPPQAPEQVDPELAKSKRRVLWLADGRVIQGVANKDGTCWDLRTKSSRYFLKKGSVLKARLEKDVIKEWQLAGKTAKPEPKAQTEHVRSALENGLLTQGLEALGAVLERFPLAAEPTALLSEYSHQVHHPKIMATETDAAKLQESVLSVVEWGTKRGALARELAMIELGKVNDRKGLGDQLESWLRTGSPQRRSFAAHALRRLMPRRDQRQLLTHAVLDGSEDVRRQAALALAAAGEEALVIPVARALESSHPKVRTRAAESLANMGYPAAVPSLIASLARAAGKGSQRSVPHQHIFIGKQMAYVQDFDVEVASGVSVADPTINTLIEGAVLDVGVRGVEVQHVLRYERRVLVDSLKQLTGANPGSRAKDWTRWYEEQSQKDEDSSPTRVRR